MAPAPSPARDLLFTVGHSNHPIDRFLDLLLQHEIEVVVDTRSQPYSRFSPHFNGDALAQHLRRSRIKYLPLGKELGGRPQGERFYDDGGHVLYWKVAQSDFFSRGVQRLLTGLERNFRIALLCSEEDPAVCHRHLLVSRVLTERGIDVRHIRGDGRLEIEQDVRDRARGRHAEEQSPFLDVFEESEWKSLASVSPRKPRNSSSGS